MMAVRITVDFTVQDEGSAVDGEYSGNPSAAVVA